MLILMLAVQGESWKSKPEVKEKVRNLMVWITLVDYSQQ